MYLEHFGLKAPPFRITPNTDFFFEDADRGAMLEALAYAVLNEEGIVKVSGEVGSGKTMLCRMLMQRLPAGVETAFLANPSYSREDILYAIADELGLGLASRRASLALRELQDHLIRRYAEDRRVVVLIDEAHAMPLETLEEVRLLSNLESTRHKLLQIVLFGQPELDAALARPGLRQLKDRITHHFRMRALTEAEVGRYLAFRMRAAGYRGPDVFTPSAVALLARGSSGLTRRINVLADKSLLSVFTGNRCAVTPRDVRAAISDSEYPVPARLTRPVSRLAAGIAVCAGGILVGAAAQWWIAGRVPESAPGRGSVMAGQAAAAATTPPARQVQESPPRTAQNEETHSLLAGEQERRIDAYATAGQSLLGERIAAARERLQREPDRSYCVELFVTQNSDPARLARFLVRARDLLPLENLYVIPIASGSRYRIRVVYGAFPDRDAAAAAARRLPTKYQRAFRVELRTFAELRDAV